MKINNIQINGFGTLKDKNLKLEDGINLIYGNNETGKSTLANFIKAIFYGVNRNKNGNAFSEFDAVDYFTVEETQKFVKEGNDIVAQTDNSSKAEKQIEKFFPTDFDIEIPLEQLDTAPDEWNFFKLPDEETFKLIIKSIY